MDTNIDVSEESLARIKRLTLEKAGFAPPRSARRTPVKAMLMIAAVLCVTAITAFASPKLRNTLAGLFGDDLVILHKLNLLDGYGQSLGAAAEDEGITIRIEEAYRNKTGVLLLFSMTDKRNRLTESSSFNGILGKDDITPFSVSNCEQDTGSGTIFGIFDVFSTSSFETETEVTMNEVILDNRYVSNVETSIDIGDHVRYMDNYGVTSIPGDTPDGSLNLAVPELPGLVIHDIFCNAEGLVIRAGYDQQEQADVRINRFSLSLKSPDSEIVEPSYIASEAGIAGSETGFKGLTDVHGLRGYRLLISYPEERGVIKGEWTLAFTMPEPDASEQRLLSQTVEADGCKFSIDSLTVTKNSIIAAVTVIERPARVREAAQAASARTPFSESGEPPYLYLTLCESGTDNPAGMISSSYQLGADVGESYDIMLMYYGKLENLELCGYINDTEVCRIKLR